VRPAFSGRQRAERSSRRAVHAGSRALQSLAEGRGVGIEEPLGQLLAGLHRRGPRESGEESGRHAPQVAVTALGGGRLEVLGELALQRAPDLLAVRAQLLEGLLDLLREHRLGEVGIGPEDRPPDALEGALRSAEQEEGGARGGPGHLRRLASKPGRDVDGGPACGLEPDDLALEVLARG
jgi:hypothetical protein